MNKKFENKIKDTILYNSINIIEDKIRNIYNKSQSIVPVDTGFLKSSWFKRTLELSDNKYIVKFGYGAYYAKFVDLGTVRMYPRNYFVPIVKKELGIYD